MTARIALVLVLLSASAFGQSPDPPSRAEAVRLNAAAVQAFEGGDLLAALPLFRRALELDPKDAAIRSNAARCLVALGDRHLAARRYDEAVRDYHEAGGVAPKSAVGPLREALARYRQLRDRDAEAILKVLARDHPGESQVHLLYASVLYRLGENARAIEAWERVLQLDPENVKAKERLERVRREEAVEKELFVDLSAAHFSIKYDGAKDLALGRQVSQALEAAYQSVGALLGRYPRSEVSVVVYPAKTFRKATGAHGWVAGLYDGKIRVPGGGLGQALPREVRRVLTHEYAHALLRAVGGARVPTWLHEGVAQVAEGRTRASARRALTWAAAPTLAQLQGSFSAKADVRVVRRLYAGACDFVHSLFAQGGGPALADLLAELAKGRPVDASLLRIYGQTLRELYAAWRASLPR